MMCPILTANSTMYYLGSCNTAGPDGMCHHKCIAKSKQKRLEKGEKICRIWPMSMVLLSCKTNHQMLKYKREKKKEREREWEERENYIFTGRKSQRSGNLQLTPRLSPWHFSYIDVSKSSRPQSAYSFQWWLVSGERTLPKSLVLSLVLSLYCCCIRNENILLLF